MVNFYDMFGINQSDVIKMFSTITRLFWNDWIVSTCPVKYHKIMRDFSITDLRCYWTAFVQWIHVLVTG